MLIAMIKGPDYLRLTDLSRDPIISSDIVVQGDPAHYVYDKFDKLSKVTYYWFLGKEFRGDMVSLYSSLEHLRVTNMQFLLIRTKLSQATRLGEQIKSKCEREGKMEEERAVASSLPLPIAFSWWFQEAFLLANVTNLPFPIPSLPPQTVLGISFF